MIKAVIFDVDGTLVDSVGLHAEAWVDAFTEFGIHAGLHAVRTQIGKRGDQLLPVFMSEGDIAARGETLEKRRGVILKQHYLPRIEAFPGVRALFERLIADGKRVALASSAKRDELAAYKRIANIEDLVGAETSSDDAERSKPHPDIFHAAIQRLEGLAPAEIVVVGDTPYDAEAASKAGLRTIGLTCGGWPAARLTQAGCIVTYAGPADLLANYDTSPLAA